MANQYSVKDITGITGLSRNRIFYWSKTLGVVAPECVSPHRRKYDLRSLLDFRLIAELIKIGMGPQVIEKSIVPEKKVDADGRKSPMPRGRVWDAFIADRRRYEHKGLFLYSKETGESLKGDGGASTVEYCHGTSAEVEANLSGILKQVSIGTASLLVVNLLMIIHEVEKKAFEELK
jgi:hypothetical protein